MALSNDTAGGAASTPKESGQCPGGGTIVPAGQRRPRPGDWRPARRWDREGRDPMRLAESTPVTDESSLGEAVRRLLPGPRLLAIGEAMHGEETFLRVRNTLFRYLVEHAHYRAIALESSCLRGRLVDAAVQ